jgi:hypothetical protein
VPESPYRKLLRHAGCEYRDLEALVRREGLEGALLILFRQGVYLTVAELRGRRPVQRGSLTLQVDLERVRSAARRVPWPRATSAGRTAGLRLLHHAMFADLSVNAMLALASRAGPALAQWRFAHWTLDVSDDAIVWLMRFHGPGYAPIRWFNSTPPRDPRWSARARGVSWLAPLISRCVASPLPGPEYVPLTEARAILDWFQDELRAGRTPHLQATVSSTVALVEYADVSGRDLKGVKLGLDSEMVTPARLAAVQRTGASALPTYGARESGLLGYGCTAPAAADDMHLYTDGHAVIQPGPAGAAAGLPADALLITSLRPSWPLVLLNASLGDRADLIDRACSCPLEREGWRTHVGDVRSFEKLSLGGPFVMLDDVVDVLERDLPRRFGGGPTDYQLLLATARDDGETLLRLRIHPRIGAVDERAVLDRVTAAIDATGLPVTLLRSRSSTGWLEVERQPPEPSPRGKLLPIRDGRGINARAARDAARAPGGRDGP